MERERIDQIFWMLDDYLNELSYALGEVTLEVDEESLEEKVAEVAEVIDYLDGLLAVGPKPNRVAVEVYKGRVVNVMAERPSPSEIVVTVLNYDAPIVATDDSGREHLTVLQDVWGTDDRPIKQLNAVNVEPEEEA